MGEGFAVRVGLSRRWGWQWAIPHEYWWTFVVGPLWLLVYRNHFDRVDVDADFDDAA